jgi:RNA polymerase sigma-70 factor (ECF subfamily)
MTPSYRLQVRKLILPPLHATHIIYLHSIAEQEHFASLMNKSSDYIERAWEEYNERLLYFIQTHVQSKDDAEDILSKVYLKLAQETDASRIPQKLPSWLYRVARNTIIDFYRLRKPTNSLSDELKQEKSERQSISKLSECILPIINELPEMYKLPILLSEIHEKKQKDVAKELGISLPAVKSRIVRGRKKLKELMAKRCTYYYDEKGHLIDHQETPAQLIESKD